MTEKKRLKTYGDFIKASAKLFGRELSKDERSALVDSVLRPFEERSKDPALPPVVRQVLEVYAKSVQALVHEAHTLAICPEPDKDWRERPEESVTGIALARAISYIPKDRLPRSARDLLKVWAERHPNIWPSDKDMYKKSGFSERSSKRWKNALEQANWVCVHPDSHRNGGRRKYTKSKSGNNTAWILNARGTLQEAGADGRMMKDLGKLLPPWVPEFLKGCHFGTLNDAKGVMVAPLPSDTVPERHPKEPIGCHSGTRTEHCCTDNKNLHNTPDVTAAPTVEWVCKRFAEICKTCGESVSSSPSRLLMTDRQQTLPALLVGKTCADVDAALQEYVKRHPWTSPGTGKVQTNYPLYKFVDEFDDYFPDPKKLEDKTREDERRKAAFEEARRLHREQALREA